MVSQEWVLLPKNRNVIDEEGQVHTIVPQRVARKTTGVKRSAPSSEKKEGKRAKAADGAPKPRKKPIRKSVEELQAELETIEDPQLREKKQKKIEHEQKRLLNFYVSQDKKKKKEATEEKKNARPDWLKAADLYTAASKAYTYCAAMYAKKNQKMGQHVIDSLFEKSKQNFAEGKALLDKLSPADRELFREKQERNIDATSVDQLITKSEWTKKEIKATIRDQIFADLEAGIPLADVKAKYSDDALLSCCRVSIPEPEPQAAAQESVPAPAPTPAQETAPVLEVVMTEASTTVPASSE
jgi:hypothetical protein